MREMRTYGSVRGVPGDRHPYRDCRSPGTVIVQNTRLHETAG